MKRCLQQVCKSRSVYGGLARCNGYPVLVPTTIKSFSSSCFRNSETTAAPASSEQQSQQTTPQPETPETTPEITIDDFMKCEIVVGIIRQASFVKKSKKLVCFQVQIQPEDKPESYRQILSGIRQHYPAIASSEDTEALSSLFLGQQVLVVKNLAPKTMAGVKSHGMIMFATKKIDENAGNTLETITPVCPKDGTGVEAGTRVY